MKKGNKIGIDIAEEIEDMECDARLERRSKAIIKAMQKDPEGSFPEIFRDDSQLEAAYRLFNNPYLSFDNLLAPHTKKSVARCAHHEEVIIIHDTSTFVFSGERSGLGFVNTNNRGFLGHFSLAATVSNGATALPLGVVGAHLFVRKEKRKDKNVSQHKLRESGDCESLRWLEGVQKTQELVSPISSPIHVMDRESDIYDCTSTMVEENIRFVSRCKSNRIVKSEDPNHHLLFDALDGLPFMYRDVVSVSPRKAVSMPDQKKAYPDRKARVADVCVTATEVCVKRSRNCPNHLPPTMKINVVHVFEPTPPQGQDAVEWILLTNEPISTIDEVKKIVAVYCQRWLIEEFFKAVKTGCAYEKRQLVTFDSLSNALAITLPVAWGLLLLRAQSRVDDSLPAAPYIDAFRLAVIKAHSTRYRLPDNPTLKETAYAIAGMGGHLKRNGPPGWLTLQRGYEKLLILEEGWKMSRKRCVES